MEFYQIAIIILLIIIVYQLKNSHENFILREKQTEKESGNLQAGLNPLFSSADILSQKAHYEKASGEAAELWNKIKTSKEDGALIKDIREDALECARLTITALNRKINYQKMIEANISILNGEKISEAEKKYDENELSDIFSSNNEEVQKRYEKITEGWN